MGKYDAVVRKLKPLEQEQTYQEKLNIIKDEVEDKKTITLLKEWVRLRTEKKEIEEDLSKINKYLAAYEQLIETAYEQEGTSSIRLASGPSVSIQYEPYSTVQDKEAFRKWCIENGLENSLSLAWQTMNSLTKERLLKGEPEPDGVKAFVKTKFVLRKL